MEKQTKVFLSREVESISGVYERLPIPNGWIVINTSSGYMVTVEDRGHTWDFHENPEEVSNNI